MGALFLALGRGARPGSALGEVRAVDVAPTVLALLGIPVPDWMEGKPIPGLVTAGSGEGAPKGTSPITGLARTSPSKKYGKPHPSVWTVEHPKARFVGIAPGHDQRAHGHPAFRRILSNAVSWACGE